MKQKIQITDKNISDLFALPCVRCITKTDNGGFKVKVKIAPRTYTYAGRGDIIVEQDDGSWRIEKGGEE